MTVTRAFTVAFEGLDARPVDVQVHIAGGLPAFAIVGLPDKAVAESKERVRAALAAIGLGLLPAYCYFWNQSGDGAHLAARKYLTWILAFLVWWNFLVGHILNNIKGFGQ